MMRKFNTVFLISTVCMIAGCATPNEMRAAKPDIYFNSDKLAKDVAVCISDKWENIKTALYLRSLPTSLKFNKDGFEVVVTANGIFGSKTVALADVKELPKGSSISFYSDPIGTSSYAEILTECQ